jgi:sec-independent protein translocase protein TatB
MGTPPPIEVAYISMPDTIILMILALVVFGPRRLPQIGRQIGKLMYEFRKASNDFKFQMEEELRQSEEADRRKKEEEERQKALAAAPPAPQLEQTTAESVGATSETPSPASETTPAPETPSPSAETPSESPGTGESTGSEPAAESKLEDDPTAAAVEAARLRIQPPSTGEIVPADRPGSTPRAQEPAAEGQENDNQSGAKVAEQHETEKSEPAAHHG